MGEPNQKEVSSDEEPAAAGDQQEQNKEERQYNRFDLTGYSDNAAVCCFECFINNPRTLRTSI